MKPSQLTTLLGKTIEARLPVLVVGAPGIGKSDIVAKAAKDAGADIILSHPAVADPTDFKGLPWIDRESDGRSATFLPFGEFERALRATKPTVWFLDDLGQSSPSVQAAAMQLLLARRVDSHVLPDCVTFIAATNRRTDKAGVSGVLEPVKSRFAAIVELTADVDEWCEWGFSNGIGSDLIAFLRFRRPLLCDFQPSADMTNSPTPRTWTNLSKLQRLNLPREIELMAFAGAVGEGAASEFLAYRKLVSSMPDLDVIMKDPANAPIPTDMGLLFSVATGLGMRASEKNFGRIVTYCERLYAEKRGEFATLTLRDSQMKCPAITSTKEFGKMARGPLGVFMGGC